MTITRRTLVGAALSPLILSRASPALAQDKKAHPVVLVVGSGAAGLAAALSAAEAGASVTVLEKMPVIGGNTFVSSGYYNAPDPERQKPLGIEDSVAFFAQQTFEAGRQKGDPALARRLAEGALPTMHWLERHGVQFQPECFQVYGGLWPRTHRPVVGHGRGYVNRLGEACRAAGIPIRTESAVTEILLKDGCAAGVRLSTTEELHADGIVIASGGFSGDTRRCAELDPRLEGMGCTGRTSAQGDMLDAASRAGAALRDMREIQCNLGPPKGHKYRTGFHIDVTRYILVNLRGERFVAEDGARDVLRDALLTQPGSVAFCIVDNEGFQGMTSLFQQAGVMGERSGDTFRGETPEDLAHGLGIDPKRFGETLAAYNAAVDTKEDPQGREAWMLVRKIEKPPFFGTRVCASIHYTMGGIAIDEKARVLDRSGKPIPGLFAAGEATGGVHGSNRIGGNGLPDAFVFGRLAGWGAAGKSLDFGP